MRVAIVFPGQGTQAPGMGAPWQDHPAWKIVEQAEAALGEPLAPLVLDAPAEQLARTRDAQLAVLCTSLVAWEAAAPARSTTSSRSPGHSLGQVTALVASGALDLEDGVRFAARRAELTQARGRRRTRAAWPRCSARRSSRPTTRAPPRPTRAGSRTTTRRARS